MKIFLTGGGTGGSVTPLLAIWEEIKKSNSDVEGCWIGARTGPEKELVAALHLPFYPIVTAKWRRYWSVQNFSAPFLLALGFLQSLWLILRLRPNLILSAGSFVSVPVVWAGWVLGAPALIHQQDVRLGLANKLMLPFAKKITVALPITIEKYLKNCPKAILTGNPVRQEILSGSAEEGRRIFGLEPDLPTVLVIGGGTGALKINQLIQEALPELTVFCQIIHLTGEQKAQAISIPRYHQIAFLMADKLKHAYRVACLVISRAGMGVLTELSALAKPAIIIPIPGTHQEENAEYFEENNAAVVLNQNQLTPSLLVQQIKNLISQSDERRRLEQKIFSLLIPDAAQRIVSECQQILLYSFSSHSP